MENEEGKEETERVVFSRREEKIYREICTHRKRNGEVSGGSGRVESRLRKQRGLFTVCIKAIMSSRGIEPPLWLSIIYSVVLYLVRDDREHSVVHLNTEHCHPRLHGYCRYTINACSWIDYKDRSVGGAFRDSSSKILDLHGRQGRSECWFYTMDDSRPLKCICRRMNGGWSRVHVLLWAPRAINHESYLVLYE